MADYDKGEITDRERLAAEHQKEIAKWNADATKNQLQQQLGNYDFANKQNRALADVELKQNSRKSESDRFNAMRDLQNAALGVFGSMNQAMNGSTVGNLMKMLESRNDRDNETYWTQLQVNQDQVNNAYNEALNQNNVAKNDAAINAEQVLRGMEADLAANLNNINPNLYEAPGTGSANFNGTGTYENNRVLDQPGIEFLADTSLLAPTPNQSELAPVQPTTPSTDNNNATNNTTTTPANPSNPSAGNTYPNPNRASINIAELAQYLMPDNSVQTARKMSPRNVLKGSSSYFNRLINNFNRR